VAIITNSIRDCPERTSFAVKLRWLFYKSQKWSIHQTLLTILKKSSRVSSEMSVWKGCTELCSQGTQGLLHVLFIVLYLPRWGFINPLNAELNTVCHLLTLLGAHHILHVSRIRINAFITSLNFLSSFSKYKNGKDKVTLHSEPPYIQSHTVFITVVIL